MSTDKATPPKRLWIDLASLRNFKSRGVMNCWPAAADESSVAYVLADHFDEVVAALEDVLRTGLNGGNSMRLAYIAAGQKALTDDLLARAERSEEAVQRARKALAAVKGEK